MLVDTSSLLEFMLDNVAASIKTDFGTGLSVSDSLKTTEVWQKAGACSHVSLP